MEVAIIVIVVFVVLLLVVIALVRLCSKFNFLNCCDNDSDTESVGEEGDGRDSDTLEDEGHGGRNVLEDEEDADDLQDAFGEDEDELHDGTFAGFTSDQVTVEVDGEEYVVNKMEESLL